MRVLVCGGRDFADWPAIQKHLGPFGGGTHLAHGDARGADRLAGKYGLIHGWKVTAYPADWKAHGKGAGPRRNQRMLDEFKPELVVAFPGGRGTDDMIRRSRKAGVTVREVR